MIMARQLDLLDPAWHSSPVPTPRNNLAKELEKYNHSSTEGLLSSSLSNLPSPARFADAPCAQSFAKSDICLNGIIDRCHDAPDRPNILSRRPHFTSRYVYGSSGFSGSSSPSDAPNSSICEQLCLMHASGYSADGVSFVASSCTHPPAHFSLSQMASLPLPTVASLPLPSAASPGPMLEVIVPQPFINSQTHGFAETLGRVASQRRSRHHYLSTECEADGDRWPRCVMLEYYFVCMREVCALAVFS